MASKQRNERGYLREKRGRGKQRPLAAAWRSTIKSGQDGGDDSSSSSSDKCV